MVYANDSHVLFNLLLILWRWKPAVLCRTNIQCGLNARKFNISYFLSIWKTSNYAKPHRPISMTLALLDCELMRSNHFLYEANAIIQRIDWPTKVFVNSIGKIRCPKTPRISHYNILCYRLKSSSKMLH